MSSGQASGNIGSLIYFTVALLLGAYFTFAAVQGDFGVFRRVEIVAEKEALAGERDRLRAELAEVQNLTLRLSDEFLDLDLLDQQAREVLGYLRPDEIVIH